MTLYETAALLIDILSKVGIKECWFSNGGVSINYKRHQRKDLLAVLNSVRDKLTHIDIECTLVNGSSSVSYQKMRVVRIQNRPISIQYYKR